MKIMKGLMAVAVAGMLLSGCAGMNEGLTPDTRTDAAGGILGAVLDSGEPWRGATIGAAAGAAAGGWTGREMEANQTVPIIEANADIVDQATLDAARLNSSVRYSRTTENGVNEEIVAMPGSQTGNYRFVTIRYFRDGKLISLETREVAVMMSGGHAATGLRQSSGTRVAEEATVDVKVNVLLERAYVQSVAGPGSAIDEWVIAEPVSNNVVTIYVTVREKEVDKIKTITSFYKGLGWGKNSFNTRVPKNSEIQFRLRFGGRGPRMTNVGFVTIGTAPTQTIVINLLASGATIE